MPKITIKDVARKAGVSLSTVSRVMNDNYPVHEQTRAAVLSAIAALDYMPDGAARSLKTNRTQVIGIVVPDVANQFFVQLIKGVERCVSAHGYAVMIASTDERPAKEQATLNILYEKKVDAIILTTCQIDPSGFARPHHRYVPTVFVDRTIEGLTIDTVSEENEIGAERLTEFLIARGHRSIGLVNSTKRVDTSKRRYDGFLSAMRAHGIPVDPSLLVEAPGYDACAPLIRALFEGKPRSMWPTALFATNNRRAEITLGTLFEMGIRVPEDVSVVGYGNVAAPELLALKLTHIEQDTQRLGAMAGELALKRIAEQHPPARPESLSITPELIPGNSHRTL